MNVVSEYLMYHVLIKVFILSIDSHMIVRRHSNIMITCKLINELIDAIFENVIAYLCAYTDKFECQLH